MKSSYTLGKKSVQLFLKRSVQMSTRLIDYIIDHANPFWAHLCYFTFLSLLGYFILKVSNPRTNYNLNNLDLLFTSVSATTVSSMSVLEMEVFSNDQLIVITILMLLGGEVFTSMLALHFRRLNTSFDKNSNRVSSDMIIPTSQNIELGVKSIILTRNSSSNDEEGTSSLMQSSIKALRHVVLVYLIVVQVVGSSLVSRYIILTPNAYDVLKSKGIVLGTFSIFTVVSTFSSCGYIPNNEGMISFQKNSGLLLIILPQIFLGNTLFPVCLRFVIWVLERFSKRKEYAYILSNYRDLGYDHLMSSKESWFLLGTVFVFWMLQFAMFCIMEWRSTIMEGLNSLEKVVVSLFQTANSRHSGESIVDLSMVSSAILVVFVVMMYLPPYTSFIPIGDQRPEAPEENNESDKKHKKNNIVENMLFSQLGYLAIFVIIICITERDSLKHDPLNFTVLNIVFEVISAYGNVGFSTGYSCKRRLNLERICEEKMYGFVGRWSNAGKLTLILVMFFGRLKNFTFHTGKAWILS